MTHRFLITAAALAALALAGPAATRPLKPEQEAKIRPAGPPVDCIQIRSIRTMQIRDDRTIDFYMTGRKVYRNTLPHSCPQLGFEEKFSYATSLSQLCSVDIITVLTSTQGIRGASCGLGTFQPISGAPK